MELLDRFQIIPYELELRDTLDAALHRLTLLQDAAVECTELAGKLVRNGRIDHDAFQAKGRSQTRIFDHLDAFLAAYARVSLLIFPVGKEAFTKRRGATMQSCLGVDAGSKLANRDLRDSWMHHDERLDQALADGQDANGQVFKLSSAVTEETKRAFLRVIEIDSLVVHHRDREGNLCSADLKLVRAALEAVDERRVTAFDDLPVPEDGE